MSCTKDCPIAASIIDKARAKGMNRSNAYSFLQSQLPVADHSPINQTIMQKIASNYKLPCWHRGMCRKSNGKLCRQQAVLHENMFKEIRRQVDRNLPPSSAKEYLTSSDVCIAVRFRVTKQKECVAVGSTASASAAAASSLPEPFCKIFTLAKVVLRPVTAVLAAMDYDDSVVGCGETSAQFRLSSDNSLVLCTSWEMCADLLKQDVETVWVTVLEHRPMPAPQLSSHLISWFCHGDKQCSSAAVVITNPLCATTISEHLRTFDLLRETAGNPNV